MGELELFGLSRIFQIIADNEQTGTLRIQKDDKEVFIYFEKGLVKLLASPYKRSVLAEGLLKCHKIDKDVVEKIFKKQRTSKKSLLSILKEEDIADERLKDENFIIEICKAQIGEDIYEIFSWGEVHCEFIENEVVENVFEADLLKLPIALNPGALVMEAARRQDEWGLIRKVIPSNKDVPYIIHKRDKEDKEKDEKELLEKIEGLIKDLKNWNELLKEANIEEEDAKNFFLKLAKEGKLALKKPKELKKVLNILKLLKDIKDFKKILENLKMTEEEAVSIFIELSQAEKISVEEKDSLEKVLSLLQLINGIRDVDEILEQARMSSFEAMKIMSGLVENKRIALKEAKELKQMTSLDIVRKDIYKCIKLYERVEELGLKNIETIKWLAKAYESTGLTNKAVEKYRELGVNAMESKNYKEAIDAYKRVVEFAPEDLEAYEKLIQAYTKDGQKEKAAEISAIYAKKVAVYDKRKAIMVLDEANKIFPSSPSNLELMATLYLELEDKENAILTYNILANLMKKQEDLEKTLEAYRKILEIDNTNIKAHIELAQGLISLGKVKEGVKQYKELGKLLITKITDDPSKIDEVSDILIKVCEYIIQYEPNNITAREWLVDTYILKGEDKIALNILRELLGLLQKEENLDKLVTNLRKVVTMDPDDFRSRKMLADILCKKGERMAAIQEYTQLGLNALEKNDLRRARESFEAILNIDPFNFLARQKRAEILCNLNLQAKAVEEYKLVGYLAKTINKIEDAINAFVKVVELAPDKELWGFNEVARLCEHIGDYKKAVKYYKDYAHRNIMRGNYGEAYSSVYRVLEIDPNDKEAMEIKRLTEEKFELLEKYIK